MGRLRVGEAMSPPFMRQVKSRLKDIIAANGRDAIIDAPPGVSCPAVTAVIDSDVIVLVTEPTPFGFHDFKLACEAFSPLGKPMGVVVNRAGIGNGDVYTFCRREGIPVLAEIPFERAVAEAYARGRIIADLSTEFRDIFVSIRAKICESGFKADSQGGGPCVKWSSSVARAGPARPRSRGHLLTLPQTRSFAIWTWTPQTFTCC